MKNVNLVTRLLINETDSATGGSLQKDPEFPDNYFYKKAFTYRKEIKTLKVYLGDPEKKPSVFQLFETEFNSGRVGWTCKDNTKEYSIYANVVPFDENCVFGFTVRIELKETEPQNIKESFPKAWLPVEEKEPVT